MIVGSVVGMGIVEKGPKAAKVMPFLMGILGAINNIDYKNVVMLTQ